MSMNELSEKAGIAKSYISSIERNLQKNPSIQFLEKVSAALGIGVDALLYDEPENQNIDGDWLKIAEEAMDSGITKKQFREFIEANK